MINNNKQIKEYMKYVYLLIELIDFCEEFNREKNLVSFFIEKGHALYFDGTILNCITQSLGSSTFFRYIYSYNKVKFWWNKFVYHSGIFLAQSHFPVRSSKAWPSLHPLRLGISPLTQT